MSKESNQNQERTQAYDQPEFNPNDTEFAQENANFANPLATNNIEAQNSEDAEFAQEHGLSGAPEGTKDARGGNNNPNGASGYTSGRVDDRGRKEADPRQADENRTHPNSNVGYTDDQRTGGNQ